MERKVTQVEFLMPKKLQTKRVAAYARVSSGKDAMLHSLSAQISYYSNLIQTHRDWIYCGVYADEAKTGTKDTRENFQRLIADCKAGKIDMVITKSISRFARNTVTLLQTIRELKSLGVDVYFEEQNIHTMSADGELLLTILASYAQEESRSASENQKWRVREKFEQGMPWNGALLGYRLKNGNYEIVPEEAELVRRIYDEYLSGLGYLMIAKHLNEDGIFSRLGKQWGHAAISKILSNYTYTGNLILQKTFKENHITKKKLINEGELPKYHAENTHEAIIDTETFRAVQEEKARRKAQFYKKPVPKKLYPFTSLLVCEKCGKNYRRKVTKTGPVWICGTFNSMGKAVCASKQIPEHTLYRATEEVIGGNVTGETLRRQIINIVVCNGNKLRFHFTDGTETERIWQDRSRAESWTEEMKEAARQRKLERRKVDGTNSADDTAD